MGVYGQIPLLTYSQYLGHSAADVGATGMITMLASLIPLIIGKALMKFNEKKGLKK